MMVYYANEPLTTPRKFWTAKGEEGAQSFDAFARADDAMRRTAREIVAGAQGDDEKLARLVDWCRREIRVAPSSAPETLRAHHINNNPHARAVLKQRAGTAFELDLLFGALARATGFDVRYVRVASRRRIYFDQEMVDLRFLPSYDIAVRVGGRWRCFDPQARRLPWDMLPWDEESQLALLCDPDSAQFIETQYSDPAQSVRSRSGELLLDEEGTLAGEVRIELSGHWNALFYETLEGEPDSVAALREVMDWNGSWLELSDLRIEKGAREHDPARVAVRVRIASHAAPSGRRMLLEPSAWWAHREPEFGASTRKWPVEFRFAWTDRDSLRIRLPAGWKCEAVTSPRPVVAPGVGQMRTELRQQESGAVIEYRREFELGHDGQVVFPASSWAALQKLFGLFLEADRTTATLVPVGEP
jgi:hypothetical protein